MLCQLDLVCLAEQQKGQTTQQAAQGPSCSKRPIADYAFNPNARSFVPSKVFRRVSVQTLKPDSRFALNTAFIASQAAPPESRSAAPEPASPRIAAKLAAPSSHKSSSTQEASARPTPMQPAAVDTAPEAGASKLNISTTPGSDSQSAADAQGLLANCVRDPCLTDGKEQL